MTVRRYPIGAIGGIPAELRVVTNHGLVVVAIHRRDRSSSGPLAIPVSALDTLRSALADAAGETGSSEATPDAQASRQGDVSRGGGTSP